MFMYKVVYTATVTSSETYDIHLGLMSLLTLLER